MPDKSAPRFDETGDGRSGTVPDDVGAQASPSGVDLLGPRRVLIGVLIVALAVALGFFAGKTAGSSARATPAVVPQVTATQTVLNQVTTTQTITAQATVSRPVLSGNRLIGTGARCSLQNGQQLQLGVEVRNEFDAPLTLVSMQVRTPMGGLRPVSNVRGPCGELPGSDSGINGYVLAVGASVWLTVTVDVLTGCPTALPLTMQLDYTENGHAATTMPNGFPDLGGVPYTGCH